jgi:hypothetical protein
MVSKPKKVSRPTVIDPLFQIPFGAEDEFTHTKSIRDYDDDVFLENNGLSPVASPFGTLYTQGSTVASQQFSPPRNLVIFDQRVRREAGTVVVDVTTDFEDVPSAQRYEVRVIKI